MSQGSRSDIVAWQDFGHLIDPGAVISIADNATNYDYSPISLFAGGGQMDLSSTVDEPGGVLNVASAGGDNEGILFVGPRVRPSDGPVALEVRIKTNDMSLTHIFVGFQENGDLDDYDSGGVPYGFSGTTLTTNDFGQVVGAHFDPDASTDDWRALLSNDGTTPAAVTAATTVFNGRAADNGGVRAFANAGVATLDDEWQVIRVEVDPNGTARVIVGNNDNDVNGIGPFLTAEFGASGALGEVRLSASNLYPVVWLEERSGASRNFEIDYMLVTASRDWTV